tara:strand:+ start:693 stop:926 length:234 start_codon:yes stop_codon:yes gene_type:complete
MLSDEQRLVEINDKLFELIIELCETNQHRPDEIAGVLMAQGMRMYKMMLDEDAFTRLMEVIWESKDKIKPPEEIVLH